MDHDYYTLSEVTEDTTTPPTVETETPLPLANALSAAETRRQFSRLGLSMLVLSVAMIAAQYGLDYLLFYTIPNYATSWWRTWVLSLIPLYGVGLPLMLLSLKGLPAVPHNTHYLRPAVGFLPPEKQEKSRFTVGHWFILLVIGFGCMYIGNIIGTTLMAILSAITGYEYANALNSIIDESPLWMTFIGTCICAPFGEELLFRKLLIDRSRRFGDTVSILISGFFFGLFHANLFQFFYAFLLGMVLAYIYTRTGKYLLCVAMHAVVNFVGGIVMPELSKLLPDTTDPDALLNMTPVQSLVSSFMSMWVYGSIIAGIVLFIIFFKQRQLSRGSSPLNRRTTPYEVMLNPGMLANFIVMSLMMVISLIPQY